MIKNVLMKIGIFIIVFLLGFLSYYLYENININQLEEDSVEIKKTYTEYTVFEDSIESYISYDGQIKLSDEQVYFGYMELEYKNNSYECDFSKKKGDFISKGEYVGKSYDGKSYKNVYTNSNIKIDNIEFNNEEKSFVVRYLNYDLLYFSVYISKQDLNKIDYGTKVYYINEGKKTNCTIDYIGSEILEGDLVEVKIKTNKSKKNLPGESKTINFVTDKKRKRLLLSADAIVLKGESAYVLKKEGEEYIEREISIGSKITIEEGRNKFDFYVIKSGLRDGDEVYVETISNKKNEGLEEIASEK